MVCQDSSSKQHNSKYFTNTLNAFLNDYVCKTTQMNIKCQIIVLATLLYSKNLHYKANTQK